jgi:hypothetical protein
MSAAPVTAEKLQLHWNANANVSARRLSNDFLSITTLHGSRFLFPTAFYS